jgi:heme/copper-type cytochrome/quinol oxidase subunit 3
LSLIPIIHVVPALEHAMTTWLTAHGRTVTTNGLAAKLSTRFVNVIWLAIYSVVYP